MFDSSRFASETSTTTPLNLPLGPPSRTFQLFACRFHRICRSNGQLWSTCRSLRGRWRRCWYESFPLALFLLKNFTVLRRDVPVIEKQGKRALLTKEEFMAWVNSVKSQQVCHLLRVAHRLPLKISAKILQLPTSRAELFLDLSKESDFQIFTYCKFQITVTRRKIKRNVMKMVLFFCLILWT